MQGAEISVIYANNFTQDNDDYFVFEANDDIVKSLKQGEKLVIKSEKQDSDAYLCTSEKTYQLRRNDYTNLFLFADDGRGKGELDFKNQLDQTIVASKSSIVFLENYIPEKAKLIQMLNRKKITEANSQDTWSQGFTIEELLAELIVSPKELDKYLNDVGAVNIGSKWALVEESYYSNILHEILFQINLNQIDRSKIMFPAIAEKYCVNIPSYMLQHRSILLQKTINRFLVLSCLFRHFKNISCTPEESCFAMDFDKLLAFFCKELLVVKESYYWQDYLDAFRNMVETHIPLSYTEQLSETQKTEAFFKAIVNISVIVDTNPLNAFHFIEKYTTIRYIDKNQLPCDIKERLEYLFSIKSRYFPQEIQVFFDDLATKPAEMDQIMMKNTRTIYEKVSKGCYAHYTKIYPQYISNFSEVPGSNGSYYEGKFYVKK